MRMDSQNPNVEHKERSHHRRMGFRGVLECRYVSKERGTKSVVVMAEWERQWAID